MIRAEQYLKAFPDQQLTKHGPGEVQAYLEKIGRKEGLEDWQHHQIVDAIQNLFQLIEADWLEQVDWGFWKSSARSLSPDHPTIARDVTATNGYEKSYESKDKNTSLARSRHTEVLTKLINEIRRRGYSIRTEQAYEGWAARYIAFSGNRNPKQLGAKEVFSFLKHLAVRRNVSTSTQSQALNALVFLYDQILKQPLGDLGNFARPKRPRRLPVVLAQPEILRLLEKMDGIHYLIYTHVLNRGGKGVVSPLDAF